MEPARELAARVVPRAVEVEAPVHVEVAAATVQLERFGDASCQRYAMNNGATFLLPTEGPDTYERTRRRSGRSGTHASASRLLRGASAVHGAATSVRTARVNQGGSTVSRDDGLARALADLEAWRINSSPYIIGDGVPAAHGSSTSPQLVVLSSAGAPQGEDDGDADAHEEKRACGCSQSDGSAPATGHASTCANNGTLAFVAFGVTVVRAEEFAFREDVTALVIPDSVTTIQERAFEGCTSLAKITLPNSVTVIHEKAFQGCTSLVRITLPDSITTIGPAAFHGCAALQAATLPKYLTEIPPRLFEGCASLEFCVPPQQVYSVGGDAFSGCRKLNSVSRHVEMCN